MTRFFKNSNQSPLSSTLNNTDPKVTLNDEGEVSEPNTKLQQFAIKEGKGAGIEKE